MTTQITNFELNRPAVLLEAINAAFDDKIYAQARLGKLRLLKRRATNEFTVARIQSEQKALQKRIKNYGERLTELDAMLHSYIVSNQIESESINQPQQKLKTA